MSEDLDLNIQLNSSWVHVPAWAHMTSTPDIYDDILAKFPSLRGLPVQLNGAKVLGCPLGSPAYTRAETDKLASSIISLYHKIRDVPDGRIHFQLVKFCIHTKFQYILRCLPPAATTEAATRLDVAACGAVMTYGGWPDPDDPNMTETPAFGRGKTKLQLPHEFGGFGLISLAHVANS
eukprot:3315524-Rhodomonas_salina.1